jgi:hypothetical protein
MVTASHVELYQITWGSSEERGAAAPLPWPHPATHVDKGQTANTDFCVDHEGGAQKAQNSQKRAPKAPDKPMIKQSGGDAPPPALKWVPVPHIGTLSTPVSNMQGVDHTQTREDTDIARAKFPEETWTLPAPAPASKM